MPEGPEIRRAADRIAKVLVGSEIEEAFFAFRHLQDFIPRLEGTTVTGIETRGKAMLTRFANGLTLYSHNQLYGRWYTGKRDWLPKTKRSLRVALHTAKHSALLYSASDVDVLDQRQLETHPFLSRIGPDILDQKLTVAGVSARLRDKRYCGRSTGALYLDQGFLAGVGNYLRSEILYCARIHPAARPADLESRQRTKLAGETLRLSRRSYQTGGVTLAPGLATRLSRDASKRRRPRFYVFAREGLPCYECGCPIERISVASRGLFFCVRCQTRPARAAVT